MTQDYGRRVAVIIDDDPDTRSLVETVLIQSGFETVTASNGKDGIALVARHQPSITTLDVNMPGMDGFTAARLIRDVSATHIIMLTALDDEIDVVEGLGAGADDYIVKPFRPRELRARVERGMKRQSAAVAAAESAVAAGDAPADETVAPVAVPVALVAPPVTQPVAQSVSQSVSQSGTQPVTQPAANPVAPAPVAALAVATATVAPAGVDTLLRHDGLELDEATRIIRVDGKHLELTRSEFDLMAALLHSGRRVRSKADLVLALRGESYVTDYYVTDADKRAIEVHIANLRRKIGDSTSTPRWIETVRGVGYRMT